MENLKSQKNGVKEIVASCFRPSEHVSLLSIAGEHFPCSAIQPTHNSAVKLKTSHLDALKCVVLFPNRLFSFVRIKKKKRDSFPSFCDLVCHTDLQERVHSKKMFGAGGGMDEWTLRCETPETSGKV